MLLQQYTVARNDVQLDLVRRHPKASIPPAPPSAETDLKHPLNASQWIDDLLGSHLPQGVHILGVLQAQLLCGSPQQRARIAQAIKARMLPLSTHALGTWLIQALLKVHQDLRTSQSDLFEPLKNHWVDLALDNYGVQTVLGVLARADTAVVSQVMNDLLHNRVEKTFISPLASLVWARILTAPQQHESKTRARVARALKGLWAQVAQTEWGSVLVQLYLQDEGLEHEVVDELLSASPQLLMHPQGVHVGMSLVGETIVRTRIESSVVENATLLTLSHYFLPLLVYLLDLPSAEPFASTYAHAICSIPTLPPTLELLEPGLVGSWFRRPALVHLARNDKGSEVVQTLLDLADARAQQVLLRTVAQNAVFLKGDPNGSRVEKLCRTLSFRG